MNKQTIFKIDSFSNYYSTSNKVRSSIKKLLIFISYNEIDKMMNGLENTVIEMEENNK